MVEETKRLTSEQKAALRERAARLKTPEEMAAVMNELREGIAEVIIIGQRLLDSETAKYPTDDTRL